MNPTTIDLKRDIAAIQAALADPSQSSTIGDRIGMVNRLCAVEERLRKLELRELIRASLALVPHASELRSNLEAMAAVLEAANSFEAGRFT